MDERENYIAAAISIVLGIVACVVTCLIHGFEPASMCWGGLILFGVCAIAYAVYAIIAIATGNGNKDIDVCGKIFLGGMVVGAVISIWIANAVRVL